MSAAIIGFTLSALSLVAALTVGALTGAEHLPRSLYFVSVVFGVMGLVLLMVAVLWKAPKSTPRPSIDGPEKPIE